MENKKGEQKGEENRGNKVEKLYSISDSHLVCLKIKT